VQGGRGAAWPDGRADEQPPVAEQGEASVDPTGDRAVDEVLTRLTDVTELGLHEQLAVFDAVHTALQDRLADAEG
jgi:hypothetical protein